MRARELMYPSLIIVGLLVSALSAYAMWQLQRTWNYKLSYRAMVRETVREMVKEESLKKP